MEIENVWPHKLSFEDELKHKRILALDLGTTTGWALFNQGELQSGSVLFKTDRFQGGGMRFVLFERFLWSVYKRCSIDEVYYEEVRGHKGVDASHVYGGFQAMLTAWCEKNDIPYMGIPISHIKKFATGKGNATKKEMIHSIISRGYRAKDDNEADALALLLYKLGIE